MAHGTYRLVLGRYWELLLDPAVRMRARRVFGKVQLSRDMAITIANTIETCRDLAWFMERFPLDPADAESAAALAAGAEAHRTREAKVARLISARRVAKLRYRVEPEKTPRDYQVRAVQLLRETKRLLLTDEVGLGKTLTGLLAAALPEARPAVIVPPTHLPPRWETEWRETFPTLTFAIAKKGTPTEAELLRGIPDLLVVPYSKLDGWAGYIHEEIRTVVFDEVQELRHGAGTQKGAAAALLTGSAEYVLGLTATPVYNYGDEIWNVLDILAPGELGTREEFKREWGGSIVSGHTLVADPHALGMHLREAGIILGRTRAEVGRELPKTIKTPMLVDSDHKELDNVRTELEALAESILSSTSSPQEKFQASGEIDWRLRRATGVDKAPYVADFVRLLLESEDRVVMWGWHRDVYDIWLSKLAEFNPRLYTGSESPKQKRDAEAAFTADSVLGYDEDDNPVLDPDRCRVLIMSLRSGAGVDGLQMVCRVGVFGELDWSPQVHEQAIGRLRRDGMGDDPPVAYFLYSSEGSDPILLDTLQLKRQQSEPLITKDGQLLGNSTVDPNRGRRLAEQLLGRVTSNLDAEIANQTAPTSLDAELQQLLDAQTDEEAS